VVDPDLPCPTTAQTATAVATGFEIDGNCQVDVAGLLDWQARSDDAPLHRRAADPSRQSVFVGLRR
jgi:hypothetical protein